MLKNSPERFGTVSKLLHWLMAVLLLGLIGLGWYMTGLDPQEPMRAGLYALHQSVGAVALVLALARVLWLRVSPAPPLPPVLAIIERDVTRMATGLMYLAMLGLPLLGWLGSNWAGHGVSVFGLLQLPTLVAPNESLAESALGLHVFVAYSLALLVAMHVTGALKHRYVDKDPDADVLARMLWAPTRK